MIRRAESAVENLSGEKDQRDLDDGEHDRQERENDEGKLNDGRAVVAVIEAARYPRQSAARTPGSSRKTCIAAAQAGRVSDASLELLFNAIGRIVAKPR
jgi:hypothetical protein